jgi:menaquinone-9 beta-reductase
MSRTDVFICGGGPAGLATAIEARRRGLHVTVADCFRPPIDKACGEGLLPDALDALSALGIDITDRDSHVFHGIRFVENGSSVEARFPRRAGRGVRRSVLHELLHQRAAESGVEFRWGTQVLGMRDGEVETSTGKIRADWIVGADGIHSRVRRWAGLDQGKRTSRRIGLRRHFRTASWGEWMEVHWCDLGQAYVTPVGPEEICVVVVARERFRSVGDALEWFPDLAERLRGAESLSSERGALTEGHIYKRVTGGRVALVGDASGSVDAIAGQGLALSFLEARELGDALEQGDLSLYESRHKTIRRSAVFMSQTMLLMDRFPNLRHGMQAIFGKAPGLFEAMLSFHTGDTRLKFLGSESALDLGIHMLAEEI